ncbi:four helix bundle protein [Caldisericum sp.]|uniref:four helix bundle protein n=1 Tax=Caldisericum sp. TaxID=2499687 RepID=UPI003D120EA5
MVDRGRGWKDLVVWQKAHSFVLDVYKLITQFPKDEKYCMADQMKRAAYSIPANIVEGHSKNSKKEFSRFLYMARGSLEELKYFLLLSKDLEYISEEEFCQFTERLSELSYLLNQLIKSLTISTSSTTSKTSTPSKTSTTSTTSTPSKTSTTSTPPKMP